MKSDTEVTEKESDRATAEKVVFNIQQIESIIPHRYPFLFIDKVTEFEDSKRLVAKKCVSLNEWYFQGHFPGQPVMPGVIILEAIAQAGAVLAKASKHGIPEDQIVYLVGVEDMRWKRVVVPGDVLEIEVVTLRKRHPLWIIKGTASVDGKVVASGTMSAMAGGK